MSSNLKVNTILPSTGTTVAVSGIVSATSSVSIGSSCTATTFFGSGANLTSLPAANLTGTLPAISGANLTGLVSLSGSTNNTVATVTGANALIGEGNLKFDGTNLGVGVDPSGVSSYSTIHLKGQTSGNGGAVRLTDHGDTPDSDDFTIYKNSNAGYLRINGTDHLIAYMNGAERLKIESDGDTTISTGNLVIGTSGKGIDFSATGNISGTSSELLDDYEEGSWTPVVQGWDTFTPYSGSSYYQGWYVKVGGMVHCGWKIYIQHLTTPSSNAHVRIHGLPFTSRAVAAGPVAVMRFDIVETGITNNQWNYMGGNSNTIYLYKQTNGGNGANAINASQNYSNMWTMGTATYATDS